MNNIHWIWNTILVCLPHEVLYCIQSFRFWAWEIWHPSLIDKMSHCLGARFRISPIQNFSQFVTKSKTKLRFCTNFGDQIWYFTDLRLSTRTILIIITIDWADIIFIPVWWQLWWRLWLLWRPQLEYYWLLLSEKWSTN